MEAEDEAGIQKYKDKIKQNAVALLSVAETWEHRLELAGLAVAPLISLNCFFDSICNF